MSTPYERKTSFRRHLLETFGNGDPEGLDALLDSPNPFGHFNFRCYHNATLTEAISAAARNARCTNLVILNMYKKLVERGLDPTDHPLMLEYIVHAPISCELMNILVPTEEHIAKTVHVFWSQRNVVFARPRNPADVVQLNMLKENMNVFKNLPIVQEYLYTSETVKLDMKPADIRRHRQELNAARTRQREKQQLRKLIETILNTDKN